MSVMQGFLSGGFLGFSPLGESGVGSPKPVQSAVSCETCAVRHRSVCAAMSREQIERLNAIAHFKTYPPGHLVLSDSEIADHFGTIVSGVIKLTKSLSDGRRQIVGLLFPSDFLGRPMRRTSPYDAITVTEVRMCAFPRSRFEGLVKTHPELEHHMLAHALDELDAAQEWLLLLGRKTAAEKVASLLLLMSKRMAVSGCSTAAGGSAAVAFDLPLSRGEMAEFLGLTIETVSRQLTKLKIAGMIELHGVRGIVVPDISKLDMASEQGE